MFKQMNSHWEEGVLKALKLPEAIDLWYTELPQVWEQVAGSYSGSKIAESGRVARPFEHRWGGHRVGAYPHGGHYVATGGVFGRYVDTYTCYLLTAREQFQGDVGTIREWDWARKRGSEMGGYHGMLVQWQKRPFVLTGPPLVWWRKGTQFGEIAKIFQAQPVQTILPKRQPATYVEGVQLTLF